MASLCDDLRVLLNNPPDMVSVYGYYVGETLHGEDVAEQMAKKAMSQWIKDVETVLELAETEHELQIWRATTPQTISLGFPNEERLKIALKQIISKLESNTPPKPHDDMPESVIEEYEEARNVFPYSARSTAALLRLALQKLCKELGEKGKNLNEDIKNLVAKGLPEHIQQSLDIVRIVGNESVHPGVIDVRDDPEIALELFNLINVIVEDLISKKKRIKSRYNMLPKSKVDAIERRDSGNTLTDSK